MNKKCAEYEDLKELFTLICLVLMIVVFPTNIIVNLHNNILQHMKYQKIKLENFTNNQRRELR